MFIMASGYTPGRVRTTAMATAKVKAKATESRIMAAGGHTLNNSLTETCSLGLPCTSLVLDIHVMIN